MRVSRLAVATFVLLGAAWAVAGVLAPPALEPDRSAPTVATPAPTLATPTVVAAEPSPSAPPAVAPVARAAPIPSVLPRIDVASDQAPVLVPHTWELIVGGEIIYGRGVQERVEKYGDPARPFAKVRDLLRRADLAIATLEAPLSGDNNRYCDTCMTFVGNESYVSGLVSSGIRAVSLAANHIGDAGPAGVTDSIRVLGAAGIVAFGAGANEEAARTPAVLTTPGGRLALLAYADVPPEAYRATATRPGYAALIHDEKGYEAVRADIAAARRVADIVIVVAHWGVEYEDQPRPWVVNAAHMMVDAGADVVMGDHPHWVQSVEVYKGHYIAYSVGNFVFDQMWSTETRQGSLHRLFFDGAHLTAVRIVPTLLEDWHQPRPLSPDEPGYRQTMDRIWRHSHLPE
jgi:poly-gamma-glutamate capsule biosynthesis protein CapA/YwtB (metallophosphatase superfamily)